MEQIYLAFVDTPGFFASIIRRVIGIPYVHVGPFDGCRSKRGLQCG